MKKMIYEDTEKVKQFMTKLFETRDALQGAMNQFAKVTGHCPSVFEIRACFDEKGKFSAEKLRTVVLTRLYPDTMEVHGIKLNRDQLHKIVQVPDLSDLTQTMQLVELLIPGENFWSYFHIDENRREVREISDRVTAYCDNFRLYAVTSAEVDRLQQAYTVAGVFNAMVAESKIDPARLIIPGFLRYNQFGGFAPDPEYIKNQKLLTV